MVGVANGRTIGGGAELAPDASPDDGLVDVVVATSTGPLARLGFATSLREGDHVERDDVLVVRGRSVTVTGEEFPVNADGELYGPVSVADLDGAAGRLVCPRPRARSATSSGGSGTRPSPSPAARCCALATG